MLDIELQKSILRLFKSALIEVENKTNEINKELLQESMAQGIIFSPELNPTMYKNEYLKNFIYEEYGRDKFNLNTTFYKNWKNINEMTEEQIYFDRYLHYITTYGFNALGFYNDSTVYVPNDKLEFPENHNIVKLIYIQSISLDNVKERTKKMLTSGIALKLETIYDLVNVVRGIGIDVSLDEIKNKEAKCILSSELGIIPDNSDEILRTLCFLVTRDTSLVRSVRNYKDIKWLMISRTTEEKMKVYNYFKLLENKKNDLAESFLRNKQLWLAFKNNPEGQITVTNRKGTESFVEQQKYINSFINSLRKLAIKKHKPMKITVNLSNIKDVNVAHEFVKNPKLLDDFNIFQKIKAFNYLQFKILSNDTDTVYKNYRIRTGATYSVEKDGHKLRNNVHELVTSKDLMNILYDKITEEIDNLVGDKKFYIPENILYAAPTSEKKFINGIPEMSHIKFDNSFSVGVHWLNHINNEGKEEQTDLDLKLMSLYETIGWDYSARSRNKVLFTGDLTVAPHKSGGATEAMFIDKSSEDGYLVLLNNFTNKYDIDYKLIFEDIDDKLVPDTLKKYELARDQREKFGWDSNKIKGKRLEANHIFTQNCLTLNSTIGKAETNQKCLGIFYDKKFYFLDTNIGRGISAHRKDFLDNFLKGLVMEDGTHLTVNELLSNHLVENKEDADIDLSLENITTDTFINIFTKNDEQDGKNE